MRTVFNSFLVALVVGALFWGNCFSCPQVLLAAQKHHCCPHGKSDPKECKTQGLRNFVKVEKVVPSAAAETVSELRAPRVAADSHRVAVVVPILGVFTPPDLLPLRI